MFHHLASLGKARDSAYVPRLLVGRARELAILEAAALDARRGRGRVVLVAGGPGVGKSRLADELARLAAIAGMAIARGPAWEAGSAPAFWPWIQVGRALGAPSVASRLAGGGSPSALGTDRFELFDLCSQELARAARQRPLAVILEDLHAADQPSLLLLLFAAQQLRDQPVLLLGTYREVEMRLSAERSAALMEIGKIADTISPSPLRREDIQHLLVDALGGAADPSLIDAVHDATEGNPLFVDELLRLLETDGPQALAGSIPDGVRAAIRRHLSLVTEPCRRVLDAAAVVGREFEAATVATVAGMDPTEVAALLCEAIRVGLVVEHARRQRFTHVLVRDTLYDDQPAHARADKHRRTAEALVNALHEGDPTAPLADIARHFAEAGPETAAAAIEYAVRASRVARAQLAFEEAVPLLESALATLDRSAGRDVERRAELLVELAEARIQAGDGEGGRAACRQAAAIARTVDSPMLLARAALAFGLQFTFGRVDRELVLLLEEALSRLGADPSTERARLLARLAGALQPAPDPKLPIARAREAIAVARELGEGSTLAAVMVGAGSALQDIADPSERLPLNRELYDLAVRRTDRTLVLRAHFRLAFDLLEGGDPSGGDAEMRAYERAAEGFRQPRHHVVPAMWWAMRALMKGHFEEHARHIEEARRLAGSDSNVARQLGCHAFLAARLRGEVERSVELVGDARWFLDAIPASVAFVEALLHADRGRDVEARAALARVSAADHVASVPTILRVLLAEAVWKSKDAALARELLPAFMTFSERIGAWSMTAMFCDGPLARHVALVAVAAGRMDEAERQWARAEEAARADDDTPILVHLWLERAESTHDHQEARSLGSAARAQAAALGLPALVARADRLLEASRRRSPPRTPPAPRVHLVREGDTWTIRGAGESARLRDSRGLGMLAVLIERAGEEIAALELDAAPAAGVIDIGDSGEAIDEQARRAYKTRMRELDQELEEAERWNDLARVERAKRELDGLKSELARAVGLGGQARRSGSPGERARINVQRRVTDALRRIEAVCPELGRHLASTVRTGTLCWYDPTSRKRPSA